MALPSKGRKFFPMARGVLDFFPNALAEVANVSLSGAKQRGQDNLVWTRESEDDHADAILRHLADRGTLDTDGVRHSAKVAWRALALLQEETEIGTVVGKTIQFETPLSECSHAITLPYQRKCYLCGEELPDDH